MRSSRALKLSAETCLGVGGGEGTKMLDDGSLPGFQVADPAYQVLHLPLDAILSSLKLFQVFQDEVFDVGHGYLPGGWEQKGHGRPARPFPSFGKRFSRIDQLRC